MFLRKGQASSRGACGLIADTCDPHYIAVPITDPCVLITDPDWWLRTDREAVLRTNAHPCRRGPVAVVRLPKLCCFVSNNHIHVRSVRKPSTTLYHNSWRQEKKLKHNEMEDNKERNGEIKNIYIYIYIHTHSSKSIHMSYYLPREPVRPREWVQHHQVDEHLRRRDDLPGVRSSRNRFTTLSSD